MEPTILEVAGGAEALLALAEAWHKRCLADPILAHPSEGGVHPQHTQRLAAYWSEQLGGPASYTESLGDYSQVVRMHSGNGPHEQMDGRAVAAFVLALDDAGIPADPSLRFELIAWFTWATAMLNHRWTTPDMCRAHSLCPPGTGAAPKAGRRRSPNFLGAARRGRPPPIASGGPMTSRSGGRLNIIGRDPPSSVRTRRWLPWPSS